MDKLTPAQWLAAVADTDERPNVRQIASETLAIVRAAEDWCTNAARSAEFLTPTGRALFLAVRGRMP